MVRVTRVLALLGVVVRRRRRGGGQYLPDLESHVSHVRLLVSVCSKLPCRIRFVCLTFVICLHLYIDGMVMLSLYVTST